MHLEKPSLARHLGDPDPQGLRRAAEDLLCADCRRGQAAGGAFVERLAQRKRISTRRPDRTSPPRRSRRSVSGSRPAGRAVADLKGIHQPTLVVNGVHDEMIPVSNSYRFEREPSERRCFWCIRTPDTALCSSFTSLLRGRRRHSSRRIHPSHRAESQRGRQHPRTGEIRWAQRWFAGCALLVMASFSPAPIRARNSRRALEAISVRTADVGRAELSVLVAGHGPTIVLLHGYAETSTHVAAVDAAPGCHASR